MVMYEPIINKITPTYGEEMMNHGRRKKEKGRVRGQAYRPLQEKGSGRRNIAGSPGQTTLQIAFRKKEGSKIAH